MTRRKHEAVVSYSECAATTSGGKITVTCLSLSTAPNSDYDVGDGRVDGFNQIVRLKDDLHTAKPRTD